MRVCVCVVYGAAWLPSAVRDKIRNRPCFPDVFSSSFSRHFVIMKSRKRRDGREGVF